MALSVQVRLTALNKLCARTAPCKDEGVDVDEHHGSASSSEDGSMTVADISEAINCVLLVNAASSAMFCELIYNIVNNPSSSSHALIQEAGAIPIVLACLRSWPEDELVVHRSCDALFNLVRCGSADTKQAIRDVPDCEALLKASQSSIVRITARTRQKNGLPHVPSRLLTMLGWCVTCTHALMFRNRICDRLMIFLLQ
jgi:hypothetical protein